MSHRRKPPLLQRTGHAKKNIPANILAVYIFRAATSVSFQVPLVVNIPRAA